MMNAELDKADIDVFSSPSNGCMYRDDFSGHFIFVSVFILFFLRYFIAVRKYIANISRVT
jgi:hypothetical protein